MPISEGIPVSKYPFFKVAGNSHYNVSKALEYLCGNVRAKVFNLTRARCLQLIFGHAVSPRLTNAYHVRRTPKLILERFYRAARLLGGPPTWQGRTGRFSKYLRLLIEFAP